MHAGISEIKNLIKVVGSNYLKYGLSGFDNKTLSYHISNWFEENRCSVLFLTELFDDLPGVSFFVKDRDHRLVMVNNGFLPRLGLSQQELFGKTDFDIFLARLAEHFRREDRKF